ncbi:MAG: hypothetical protein EBR82_65215, partial [Caulobacteraceae bacterium]|nr:hypothetical protein [Caulobacteraceae bacterium]
MSEKTVVIEITAKAEDAIESIVKLKAETQRLKEEKAKLDTTTENGKKLAEGYNAAIKANEAQTRALSNATAAMAKEYNAASGSLDEMSAQIQQLNRQYMAMSKAERDSDSGKALQKSLMEKRNEFNELKKAAGDFSSNIGNYSASFIEAAKGLNFMGVNLGDIKSGLDGAKMGFQAAGGGVKGFSAALATTGLPLVIAGLQALMNIFGDFIPLVEGLEKGWAMLSAGFKAFFNGGSFSEAANAVGELVERMRDLEDLQNGLSVQTARMNNEVDKLLIRAKNRTLSEQERLAILRTASEVEKKNFEMNFAMEKELAQVQEEKFRRERNLTQSQMDAIIQTSNARDIDVKSQLESNGTLKKSDDETLKKFLDNRLKLIAMERDKLLLDEKIQNRYDQISDAQEAKEAANLQKRQQLAEKMKAQREKELEQLKQFRDAEMKYDEELNNRRIEAAAQIEQIRIELIKDATDKEIELLKFNAEEKLKKIKGNSEEEQALRSAINEKLNADLMTALERGSAAAIEQEKKLSEEELKIKQKATQERLALLEAELIETQNSKQETYDIELKMLNEKYAQEIEAAQDNATQKRLIDAKYARDKARLEEGLTQKQKIEDLNQIESSINKARIVSNVLAQTSQLAGQNTELGKGLAVASATINT